MLGDWLDNKFLPWFKGWRTMVIAALGVAIGALDAIGGTGIFSTIGLNAKTVAWLSILFGLLRYVTTSPVGEQR